MYWYRFWISPDGNLITKTFMNYPVGPIRNNYRILTTDVWLTKPDYFAVPRINLFNIVLFIWNGFVLELEEKV